MNIQKISSPILSGFGILAIVIIGSATYATLNTTVPLPQNFSSGDMVTSSGLNQMISGIQAVDTRTAEIVSKNGNVGIGTTSPNSKLEVKGKILSKTDAGSNAEISFQSGNADKWALYQDETSQNLKFWNGSNKVEIKKDGRVSGSDPVDNNDFTTKEYVDDRVDAAASSINAAASSIDPTDWLKNQECADGKVQAGYTNGVIKCVTVSGGSKSISLSLQGAISDGSGKYFSQGGAPNFCTQFTVSSAGSTTITGIHETQLCDRYSDSYCWNSKCLQKDNGGEDYCRTYDLITGDYTNQHHLSQVSNNGDLCQDGNVYVVGQECTAGTGTGTTGLIDNFHGKSWAACRNLTCPLLQVAKHVEDDGTRPDDVCRTVLYTGKWDNNTGKMNGYAFNSEIGYIKLDDSNGQYGVILPHTGGALTTGNVTGYAYNSEIGYIKFNDTAGQYGVLFNATTDQFSGYAYNDEIGYIRFDDPDQSKYGVYRNTQTNRIEGSAWNNEIGYIRFTEEDYGLVE